ncbi:MAG TPA: Nif3-like dinuclear metal center hexameric protein [Gemmatimonadaceae bacterium]|nr:Nif3-like dinuclear metal center hexameric protein [Gemmatimonadaceae bacterium]
MATIADIARNLDALLRTAEIPDYANALNGVQVETADEIVKVAAAVDVRERTIQGAVDSGANLLLAHHGLFWGGVQPLRGPYLRRIRALLNGRIALYSSHLPLDAHPELGNNALLARALDLTPQGGFARHKTTEIGVMGTTTLSTLELLERVTSLAAQHGGAVRSSTIAAGRITRGWGICTGAGATSETLREAAERGIDTLIVGEGPHHTVVDAEELGIVVMYAGHYATETLGVTALAQYVGRTYDIPWTFIAAPTGL